MLITVNSLHGLAGQEEQEINGGKNASAACHFHNNILFLP